MDNLIFLFGKWLPVVLLPPFNAMTLVGIGLIVMGWHRRWGRRIAWFGLSVTVFLSLPWVGDRTLVLIEEACRPVTRNQGQAIVVLGSGVRQSAAEFGGGPDLKPLALERVRYAARLYRATGLPVLVSGGAPDGGVPEAQVMRDVLKEDFGVPVKWVEDSSLTTRENASNSAAILKGQGIVRILLVSQAWHLPRAVHQFSRFGLEVVPAATGCADNKPIGWLDFVPDPRALSKSYLAWREALGSLWYQLIQIFT